MLSISRVFPTVLNRRVFNFNKDFSSIDFVLINLINCLIYIFVNFVHYGQHPSRLCSGWLNTPNNHYSYEMSKVFFPSSGMSNKSLVQLMQISLCFPNSYENFQLILLLQAFHQAKFHILKYLSLHLN